MTVQAAETTQAAIGPDEIPPPARGLRPGDDLSAYRAALDAALRSGRDVWGEQVLRDPDGPSFDAVADFLTPVLLGDQTYLTETGMHYLVLTEPIDSDTFTLHVADGSQIISEYTNRWGAPEWAVPFPEPPRGGDRVQVHDLLVGDTTGDATELFGGANPNVAEPALAEGWLPILQNEYIDGTGVGWRRESFATRAADSGALVSYMRLDTNTPATAVIRTRTGQATVETRLNIDGSVCLRLANGPAAEPVTVVGAAEYANARDRCEAYWREVVGGGAILSVPDERVMNAFRNVLAQNLVLGERYSIGNPYETTFLMEAHGAMLALLRWGFVDRPTACLDRLADMTNGPGPEWYESWERGVKLAAAAEHARLTGRDDLIGGHRARYLEYLDDFARQRRNDPHELLAPERYAWDIPEVIYGWHSQAVAWQGARDVVSVFESRGELVADRRAELSDFRAAIERAMAASTTTLDDGSAFIPVSMLSDETPHPDLTATRIANYWNLVAPYALATGIVEPGSDLANGLLRYMAGHGAWILGLTRFNGLYDPVTPIGTWREDGTAGYCTPGIDNAFGVQTLFFLADNDQADRLALAMYAKLAHGMTRGTYVDGEATTIGVRADEFYRSTWYPPNGTSNAMFLEALRLLLMRERHTSEGRPDALDLAWATPRWWLADSAHIALSGMPTSFGPVSFRIDSHLEQGHVDVSVALPDALDTTPPSATPTATVHVRLPVGWSVIDSATPGWDPATETLTWSGRSAANPVRLAVTRSGDTP